MTLQCQTQIRAADPAVFIGGCPRSGTTLLQRMLDHHPQLAIANDTNFVPRALEIVDRDLLASAAAGTEIPLTDRLKSTVWNYHSFYRLGIERAEFDTAAQRASTYQQFVAELFAAFIRGRGKQLGGEKTPDYVRYVPTLLGMFPDARFIHIVRDGRNTALSLRQWATEGKGPGRLAYWDVDPIAVSALWWKSFVTESDSLSHCADRYYVVRYEELVADAPKTLESISAFLDIDYAPSMIRFHEGKQAADHRKSAKRQWLPATSGLRDWKRDMPEADLAVFEALAGDSLTNLGYRLSDCSCNDDVAKRVDRARQWWDAPGRKRRPKQRSAASRHKKSWNAPTINTPNGDDAAVIAADPHLDNLASLLVNEEFRDLVRRADFPTPDRLDEIQATYVRYKKGTNCLVSYAFKDGTPFGYAVGYRSDTDKLQKASQNLQSVGSSHGFVDRQRRVAFYRFPCDPRLPQLLDLHGPQAGTSRTLSAMLSDVASFDDLKVSCLSFKPGRRCIAKVVRDGVPAGVLRMFLPADYLRARQAAKYVPTGSWNRSQRLGNSDRHHALFMSWVNGSPADMSGNLTAAAADIGRLLGAIHASPNPRLPICEMPTRIAALNNNVLAVTELVPQLRWRTDKLGRIVAESLCRAPHHLTFSHGDFHAGQIVGDRASLSVVDWDNALNAPPGFDIGTFAAHALVDAITSHGNISAVSDSIDALIDAYRAGRQLSKVALSDAALDAFIVYGLLGVATRPYRHRCADWRAHIEQLIELADQRAARLSATHHLARAVKTKDEAIILAPIVESDDQRWLGEPLSPISASAKIVPLIQNRLGSRHVRLVGIEILGHKPMRRCAAQYTFRVDSPAGAARRAVVAKIRKKGLDILAADLQRRLYDQIQGSGLSLRVAEPLGALAEWGLWLQTKLDGQNAEFQTLPTSDPDLSHRIGMALAELHQIDLRVGREHTFDTECAILEDALPCVATRCTDLAERIHAISVRCRTLLAKDDRSLWTGIHRDFYPAQVLCTTNDVGFVDLDLLSRGHRAIDVGNYIAHLKELALRRHDDPQALAAHETAFIDGYRTLMPAIGQRIIDALSIVSLARHISISRRIADRRRTTESLVALCEQLMDRYQEQYA